MNKLIVLSMVLPLFAIIFSTSVNAESRRDDGDGGQANRKAQYMIRQLHNEKQELQAKLAELQGKHNQLTKEHKKTKASLDKSSSNNEKLVARVKGNVEKYKELADKYREAISVLRKANMDNQYMVRAVQEREQWISDCSTRNVELFEANSDLLMKYGEAAGDSREFFTGIGKVEIENEVQDYRFKLEDLQVTKFKSSVNTALHTRKPDKDITDDGENEQRNIN